MIMGIDIETYSSAPLPKCGVYRYVDAPDFAEMLNHIVDELKIKNPVIIGRSFGGKVALAYATKYKTNKLYGIC